MAHESANPKVRAMVILAIVSAASLGVLDLVFKSYFNMMMDEEEQIKIYGVAPKQLNELRKAEQTRLTSSPLPIDRAMKELATHGRDEAALKEMSKTDISPQPSNDQGPAVGWVQLAKPASATPGPEQHAQAPTPTAAVEADGGSVPSADAGALASDAGGTMHVGADAAPVMAGEAGVDAANPHAEPAVHPATHPATHPSSAPPNPPPAESP